MTKLNLLQPKFSGWVKRYWPTYKFIYDGKEIELRGRPYVPKGTLYIVSGNVKIAQLTDLTVNEND